MSQNEIQRYKREFLEHVEIEKGNSLKTVENYDRYLERFFEFAKISKPGDITEDKIREYRLHLNRQPGIKVRGQSQATLKKNTQNYHLIALRAFLKYLMRRGQKSLSPEKIELAKQLRKNMTQAETILWKQLKGNKLNGLHFRRQQVILGFIVDFYCHKHSLIIEIDGEIHNKQKEQDSERERLLTGNGFRILRFTNEQVEKNLADVLEEILRNR